MDAIRQWLRWLGGIILAIYLLSHDGTRDAIGYAAKEASERIQENIGDGFDVAKEGLGELEWTN